MPYFWRWPFLLHGADSGLTRLRDVAAQLVAMTMPAVVLTTERTIALEKRQRPTLRTDQVIVEVELCGICGSDLHAAQLPQVYHSNCILGHESTGRIVAVGADVTNWKIGQRVAVNPNGNVCGRCEFCRTGRANFCRQATLETALGLQADGHSRR